MTRVGVIGVGATGSHTARQLRDAVEHLLLADPDHERLEMVVDACGSIASKAQTRGLNVDIDDFLGRVDVVVLASPSRTHAALAESFLRGGVSVVSISDAPEDVDGLLDLDQLARERGRSVVAGVGFAPGLTCLLARHAANRLDEIDEIAVAKAGTGGPACARQHHRALKQPGLVWSDGAWIERRGGSDRDLAWFPGAIGARDSYRAALPSPVLLQRAFPEAKRISARVTANRRDRLTGRLPMLRLPHADGGPGAVRVEVRGRRAGMVQTVIFGVMHHPSVAAGTTAAVCALEAVRGSLPIGAFGLSELADPRPMLRDLHTRGVQAAVFEGMSSSSSRAGHARCEHNPLP